MCSIVTFQLQFVLGVVFDSLDQLLKTAKNVDFNILIWIFSAKCLDSCAILYLATTWRQKTDAWNSGKPTGTRIHALDE